MAVCGYRSATDRDCNFKSSGPSMFCVNHTCTVGPCLASKSSAQSVCIAHSGNVDLYGAQVDVLPAAPSAVPTALRQWQAADEDAMDLPALPPKLTSTNHHAQN